MTTQMIPLSKLQVSDKNVRKTMPDKEADKRLIASIASQGVLQNLVVVPEGKGKFGVVAGGRRLRALQALAKTKTVPKHCEVRCLVKDRDADITEISLAENIGQESMHPADEFVAFAELVEQGVGIEDIAAKFGVTKSVVQKRLRLGQVAPSLLDEYRRGNLNLDCIMAFTVSDQERQLACFKELSGGYMQAHTIKRWLMGEAVSAKNGIGAFVGKTAYINSGGVLSEDLFEETVYLSDTALVSELAQAKLERAVNKLEKEQGGWLWIETTLERHETTQDLIQLQAEHVGVPQTLADEIEALEKQIMAWDDLYYDDELAEGFDDEETFSEAIEAAREKADTLDDKRDEYLQFSDEQKAYSGCVVTFDRAGKLDILTGMARKKDLPKKTATGSGEGEGTQDTQKPKAGLTQALVSDLGNYRQQATKAALLRDPAAAADVLHYTLCMQVVAGSGMRWMGRNLQDTSFTVVESKTTRDDTGQGRAFDELATAREALPLEWAEIEDGGERFAAFRTLNKKAKDQLVAYCTAVTLTIGVRGSSDEQDTLIEQLGVDFAGYWRPNKDNYFGRLTKGQMVEQFAPLMAEDWSEFHANSKKGTITDNLQTQFSEAKKDSPLAKWLPVQF